MSDLEAFGNTIQVLKDQAQSCRVHINIIMIIIAYNLENPFYLFIIFLIATRNTCH